MKKLLSIILLLTSSALFCNPRTISIHNKSQSTCTVTDQDGQYFFIKPNSIEEVETSASVLKIRPINENNERLALSTDVKIKQATHVTITRSWYVKETTYHTGLWKIISIETK